MDEAPPGVSVDGVGGAARRMKSANFSIDEMPCTTVSAVSDRPSVTLLGVSTDWQASVSSISVCDSSLVMPISTV
jgi:hypothetical protein